MILALPVDNEQIHHEANGLFLWFEREQDPKGNLIRQWLSVDGFLGVVSKELNLSQNPPLGPWKIVAGINVSCVQTWVEDYFFDVSAYYAEKIHYFISDCFQNIKLDILIQTLIFAFMQDVVHERVFTVDHYGEISQTLHIFYDLCFVKTWHVQCLQCCLNLRWSWTSPPSCIMKTSWPGRSQPSERFSWTLVWVFNRNTKIILSLCSQVFLWEARQWDDVCYIFQWLCDASPT